VNARDGLADPRVCGGLSQAVPLPLQLQRHHATFFACFLTFAHLFFAAFTIAALPAADKTRFIARICWLIERAYAFRCTPVPCAKAADWWRRGLHSDPLRPCEACFFGALKADQSTVTRVAAVVPEISCMGCPTPTVAKLGGQSLKSKVPV
jgi:hypothetical protein